VETGGDEPGSRFAFNCDIATPMRRRDSAVYAVDLFADVLVHADGVSYRVCDLEEFQQARRRGLILPGEARGAQQGLAELTGMIAGGELVAAGLPCRRAEPAVRLHGRPHSPHPGSAAERGEPGCLG